MPRIVVDIMVKPAILDPQGKALAAELPPAGFEGFSDVRQGKRFELYVDGEITDAHLETARRAAEQVLANPNMEDVVSVRVENDETEGAAS